jgi:hypothetical protein
VEDAVRWPLGFGNGHVEWPAWNVRAAVGMPALVQWRHVTLT